MYFLCVFLPPLAVLLTGRMGAFIANCFLSLTLIGGIIHAFFVVSDYKAQKRQQAMLGQIVASR